MKEKRLSMKGTKGEEYGHMDDLIDRDEKEAARVLQAVNRACADKDPIDAIITDRITNLDVTDGFMRRRSGALLTGVNMDDFIDSVSALNHRVTHQVHDRSPDLPSNRTPLLGQNFLSGQADLFEYAESPNIFGEHTDDNNQGLLSGLRASRSVDDSSSFKNQDISIDRL